MYSELKQKRNLCSEKRQQCFWFYSILSKHKQFWTAMELLYREQLFPLFVSGGNFRLFFLELEWVKKTKTNKIKFPIEGQSFFFFWFGFWTPCVSFYLFLLYNCEKTLERGMKKIAAIKEQSITGPRKWKALKLFVCARGFESYVNDSLFGNCLFFFLWVGNDMSLKKKRH